MITANTVNTGLIGHPIEHSKSPVMMNAAFFQMGLNFIYSAFSVHRGNLHNAVNGLKVLEFKGWNVTIPYKVAIQQYLDEIDETAQEIGAVNTVVNENGILRGYNTDGFGYLCSLKRETNVQIASQRVMILGAGGAARSIGFVLAKEGVKHIKIANRNVLKAEELAQSLSRYTKTDAISLRECSKEMDDITLLINTTSVGMHPDIEYTPISGNYMHPSLVVSDVIYNPKETLLLKMARKKGAAIHYGLGMLVHQAAIAIKLWTGRKAPVDLMRKKLEESGI